MSELQTSGIFAPGVIDDIQAKAEIGPLRYPRVRHSARAPLGHLRRSHLPSLLPHSHSARRLSRKVFDQDGAGHALRQEADRAGHSGHDHGHELGRALLQRQGRAGQGRGRCRVVEHDRRRRHASGRAREQPDADLRSAALALWHQHSSHAAWRMPSS